MQPHPALVAYAITTVVLTLNVLVLWGYSGVVRGRTKTAINPEDASRFGAELLEIDPMPVARVLRAHRNAQASIDPFLFLGLVYVLADGSARVAAAVFGVFTAARLAHSGAYLAGRQPWRTLFFIIGLLATLALMAGVLLQVL